MNTIINFIWKYSEKMFSQIISFSISIILARILIPKDYGTISIVFVFIAIADVFVQSGFGNALIQKKNSDNIDFSSVLFFNIILSIILYIVIYIIAPVISIYYNNKLIEKVIKVMGIRIIIGGINSVQLAYVSKYMIFKKSFKATIFGTTISGIIGIVMAYRGFGVWALVIQNLSSTIINTVILWFIIKWRPILKISFIKIIKLFSFGWKILFEGLSSTIVTQIRNLIIGKVYTPIELGYYSKAQQFPSLIVENISSSLGVILFSTMTKVQEDKSQVKDLLRKSVILSSYVLFPLLTGLGVVAKQFITVLLTEKWIECVPYLQIFCYTYAATIGMIPRHQAINSIGRSDIFMIEHILARTVGVILLIIVYRVSVMAIALSSIVGSMILSLTIMFTSKKFNQYQYSEQIFDILPIILLCIFMGVPVYFIQYIKTDIRLILLLQIISGISIYLFLSIIFKPKGYKIMIIYLTFIIKNIRGKND